jgi:hypothetical protein
VRLLSGMSHCGKKQIALEPGSSPTQSIHVHIDNSYKISACDPESRRKEASQQKKVKKRDAPRDLVSNRWPELLRLIE